MTYEDAMAWVSHWRKTGRISKGRSLLRGRHYDWRPVMLDGVEYRALLYAYDQGVSLDKLADYLEQNYESLT